MKTCKLQQPHAIFKKKTREESSPCSSGGWKTNREIQPNSQNAIFSCATQNQQHAKSRKENDKNNPISENVRKPQD